jgi:hypothetical protein
MSGIRPRIVVFVTGNIVGDTALATKLSKPLVVIYLGK